MSEYFPFIDSRLRVGAAGGIGRGVFTVADIEKNTFIEVAPVVICSLDVMKDPNLSKYVVLWGDKIALCLGWTMIYNHSDENCCEFASNQGDGLMAILTTRDISAGEQLTVNYGPKWFSSRGIEKISL